MTSLLSNETPNTISSRSEMIRHLPLPLKVQHQTGSFTQCNKEKITKQTKKKKSINLKDLPLPDFTIYDKAAII